MPLTAKKLGECGQGLALPSTRPGFGQKEGIPGAVHEALGLVPEAMGLERGAPGLPRAGPRRARRHPALLTAGERGAGPASGGADWLGSRKPIPESRCSEPNS